MKKNDFFFIPSIANLNNVYTFAPATEVVMPAVDSLIRWSIRLAGLGHKIFILEIRGSNPLWTTYF